MAAGNSASEGPEIAVSLRAEAGAAVAELAAALGGGPWGHLLLFAAPGYAAEALAAALARHFPGQPYAACATAGGIGLGLLSGPGLVAVALPRASFSGVSLLLPALPDVAPQDTIRVLQDLGHRLSEDGGGLFALTLLGGFRHREEVVLSLLQRALAGVPVVGGSAGEAEAGGYVIRNGEVARGGGLIVLLRTPLPFRIFKSDHFRPTGRKLVVTACDPDSGRVRELNGETAAAAYALAAGLRPDLLDERAFAEHLLLIKSGDDYFCRSILRREPDGSLIFHGVVDHGLVLTLAHTGHIAETLERTLAALDGALGGLAGVIGFDCLQRRREAERYALSERLSALFRRYRVAGFHSNGEQYHALHLTNTFTGIAFGRRGEAVL
ncbi:FIST N domain protein [mine drainage metagenome]|uniref:FIST N domain protein n=1 Tax=mine drainage metagenome TaxID=410659 RepID=A0A1J5S9B6_9ZZZZ